ncbi:MAG: hypothetical protein ACOX6T_15525 [Myxococcales bacterium]|jgi:hypothetical protein
MPRVTSARVKNPPEYRPFRLALWALYISAALFIVGTLAVNCFFLSRERMGVGGEPAAVEAVDAAALAGCMSELQVLYAELSGQMNQTIGSQPARSSRLQWEDWSPGWRTRLRAVGARCRLETGDVPGAKAIKEAYDRLGLLHRHYTTLAVQFSKEIGPHADKLYKAMESAQKSIETR